MVTITYGAFYAEADNFLHEFENHTKNLHFPFKISW